MEVPPRKRFKIAQIISFGLFAAAAASLLWYFLGPEVKDELLAGEQSVLAESPISELPDDALVSSLSPYANLLPVEKVSKDGEVFAVIRIPRFGDDWQRFIGEGTRWETSLNTLGVGRYRSSSWPGDTGNFAVAGHRGGFGGSFRKINELVPGDLAEVRTATAIHTYRFIESAIVTPDRIGVIADVPEVLSSAKAGGKYLTLTTCDPIWENTNRYIAWFELVE